MVYTVRYDSALLVSAQIVDHVICRRLLVVCVSFFTYTDEL